jgi:phosphoribosylglycinamide formyltransferase-1
MLNIAVFGSGRGSNFQAILNAMEKGTLPGMRIACVVSNNSSAGILDIARSRAIPAIHLSRKQFASEEEFSNRLLSLLEIHGTGLILLAGYMKLVPGRVIARYRNRILNIHPALLPKFGGAGMYGIHVHEAVVAAGEKESGVTIHCVDEAYDRGAILLQKRVPVLPEDSAESLAARVLTVEHELYPEALRQIASGEILLPATAAEGIQA